MVTPPEVIMSALFISVAAATGPLTLTKTVSKRQVQFWETTLINYRKIFTIFTMKHANAPV